MTDGLTHIAGYRLERELGRGGMGCVYIAVHPSLGYRVALKMLLPELSTNQQIVARFFNEARAASALNHPNVVRVFDVGYAETGAAYLTMELLDGESLASRLRNRRVLTELEALEIARQSAAALAAAHAAGVVHRDVKPDNIYLVRDPDVRGGERVKLLDFGIAKLAHEPGLVQTQTGAVMGTAYYMSPEQCRGAQAVDARTDVYAMGCVLFEMVCGRPPFLGEGLGEILAAHQTLPPPEARALAPALSEGMNRLIAECLAKQPAHRVQSMEILAQRCSDLARAVERGGSVTPVPVFATTLSATAGQQVTSPAAGRRRLAPILIAVAVGGAAATGVTVFALRDRGAATPPPPPPRDAAAEPAIPAGWVLVKPAKLRLGIHDELYATPEALAAAKGFRASRNIMAPAVPFLIQAHEVTWGDLRAWSAKNPGAAVPASPADAALPATGIPWQTARAYCAALGGVLPSEEQWETAARGAANRPHPWGDAAIDLELTTAYKGPQGAPAPVGTSTQDRTETVPAIFDLAGNAQEWTRDLWRDDAPDQDESWAQQGGVTYRAIRGLPLLEAAPRPLPRESAAYRDALCATGKCPPDTEELMRGVGFRCVRDAP